MNYIQDKLEDTQIDIEYRIGEVRHFFRRIKWAYQRARYGIDDSMLWGIDEYLTEHILDLVKAFRVAETYHERSKGFVRYLDTVEAAFDDYIRWRNQDEASYIANVVEQEPDYEWADIEKLRTAKRRKLKVLFNKNFEALWD